MSSLPKLDEEELMAYCEKELQRDIKIGECNVDDPQEMLDWITLIMDDAHCLYSFDADTFWNVRMELKDKYNAWTEWINPNCEANE